MNLKKTHYINTNNSIFRKAHLKYCLLFILSCLIYFLLYIGIALFLQSDIILYGGLILFIFILFYFAINRLNLILSFCRCPNCGSRLQNRINIKKYYYVNKNVKKDMDVFYDCPKCNHKVCEDINYF